MEDNTHVAIGNKEYSLEQCEILFKQLMEGVPFTSAEDAEAVVLARIGYLWHDDTPYYVMNVGSTDMRRIINALSMRIVQLIDNLNRSQQEKSQIAGRLLGQLGE